jgi:hypothetical protein
MNQRCIFDDFDTNPVPAQFQNLERVVTNFSGTLPSLDLPCPLFFSPLSYLDIPTVASSERRCCYTFLGISADFLPFLLTIVLCPLGCLPWTSLILYSRY